MTPRTAKRLLGTELPILLILPPLLLNLPALPTTKFTAFSSSKGISTATIKGAVTSASFDAAASVSSFRVRDVFAHLLTLRPPPPSVFALRTRSSIFGHNAPAWEAPGFREAMEKFLKLVESTHQPSVVQASSR